MEDIHNTVCQALDIIYCCVIHLIKGKKKIVTETKNHNATFSILFIKIKMFQHWFEF